MTGQPALVLCLQKLLFRPHLLIHTHSYRLMEEPLGADWGLTLQHVDSRSRGSNKRPSDQSRTALHSPPPDPQPPLGSSPPYSVNFLFLRAFFAEPYCVTVKLTFELLNVTLSFYPLGPGTQSVFSEFQHLFSIVPNEERAYAAAGGRPREGLFYSESFIVQPLFDLNISHPLWWHHLRSFSLLASAIIFTIFVLCLLWIISSPTSSSLSVLHTAATWTLVLRRVSQRYHTTEHLWQITNVFCDVTVVVNFDHQNLIR